MRVEDPRPVDGLGPVHGLIGISHGSRVLRSKRYGRIDQQKYILPSLGLTRILYGYTIQYWKWQSRVKAKSQGSRVQPVTAAEFWHTKTWAD